MDTMPDDTSMENPSHSPLGGLDPADLLRQGVAEDTLVDEASRSFTPPSIEELAPLFPQFEILGLIGKGGMGAVYKVRQMDLDRIVALKILPPAIGQSPEFSNRFTREARALAKLNHPGIVTLHEFGQRDGLYFIVMEFVDGVNLAQLMKTGRVSPREALAIVPQICDALQYAHDQGIVHRDIKPENVLLDRLGRVKVADFGIAKLTMFVVQPSGGSQEASLKGELHATAVVTEAGKIIGTPQYMAPEQIEHPSEVDHRADIYALGVVFYQMLTGELPGKNLQAPSKKVHIDVRLDEIVLQAMEKKPELRFQQASVMKTRVDELGAEQAQAVPQLPNQRSVLRRWWWVILFAAMIGPVVGVGAGSVLAYLMPKKFEAESVIQIQAPEGGMPGPEFLANQFDIIQSQDTLAEVSERLDLPKKWMVSEDEAVRVLKAIISVNRLQGTNLLLIRTRYTNPNDAVGVTNAVMHVYQNRFPGEVEVHEEAQMPSAPVSPNVSLVLMISGVGGLLLAPLLALGLLLVVQRVIADKGTGSTRPRMESQETGKSLRKPAIGLIASGVLQLVACFSLIAFALPAIGDEGGNPGGYAAVCFMAALSLAAAVVVLSGAVAMIKLRRHHLAVTASVVAMIAGPAAILGLPFGMWALRVLNRSDVREAFEAAPAAGKPSWLRRFFLLHLPTILVIVLIIRWVFLQPLVVQSNAMEPELPKGSWVLAWKFLPQYGEGDIIACWRYNQILVARVMGTTDSGVIVQRGSETAQRIPRKQVIGKVVSVLWRGAATAPHVVKTNPPAFANDVDPSLDRITVTFNRPMMGRSWSLTGGGETFPQINGEISFDASRTTCTQPVKLQPGRVYWVGINSPRHGNFQTNARIPAKRYVILFATRSADGKPTPIPADLVAQAKAINETPKRSAEQPGRSEKILSEYHWAQLAAEGRISGGTLVEVDGRSALKIENPHDAPLQLTLLNIETPPINGMRYTMSGEIKYEGVRGAGHLEMWSQFPQGRFFTRTLAASGSGPMSQLAGTSGWREFLLPFDRTGTTSPPAQLEVNIFLPGRGTVFIGPLKLTESESAREKVGRTEPRATHVDQVAVKDLALPMPESSIQERLVDLEIGALVARKKFLTTAPEFKQAALAVAEFTRENPSARDGNYREVLDHRRKSIAELRVRLATEYGAQHPRMLEQGYELEAVEHLIRTTNTRVIRKTDPSVRGRMKFHFDCGGDTMQFMTMRFRRQYNVRVCYESAELNQTEWMGLNSMEDFLAELEVKDASAGLTEREKERLTEVRRHQFPEDIGLSEKYYSGEIAAASLEDFFNQLTKDTPYRWRSSASGETWVISPKTGSRLDFPVTLDTQELTVEEAFEKVCSQSPTGRILLYPRQQNPPFGMVPRRDVRCRPQRFNQQPAWEVLCQIGEQAEPDSVWDLTGPLVINPGNDSVHENGVTFTAQQWLAGIDAGNYAQSWKDAAAFFQNSITEVGWSDAMEKFRKPLGALNSRKLLKAQSAKSLPGAPDGDYVVMQFNASFAAKKNAVETVTFTLEKDGTWRASGYFIR